MLEEAATVVIELMGDYDISETAQLRDSILARYTDQKVVIVDVARVTFIDSSALRALLEVRTALADRGATLKLVNPPANVSLLLEITGTTELFGLST